MSLLLADVNPHNFPMFTGAAVLALVAGLLPAKPQRYAVAQGVLILGAVVWFWFHLQRAVEWTFDRSMDASDGGPKTFAYVFGWVFALIYPVLPVWACTRLLRRVCLRCRRRPDPAKAI